MGGGGGESLVVIRRGPCSGKEGTVQVAASALRTTERSSTA